ncbi:MAG: hypothetical protein ABUS54_08915 [Actinomycetota bacterium]
MLYALLFLPAALAIVFVVTRRRPALVEERVVVPEAPTLTEDDDPFEALEHLLAELERITLDERDVDELERLAAELERTAKELERVS